MNIIFVRKELNKATTKIFIVMMGMIVVVMALIIGIFFYLIIFKVL